MLETAITILSLLCLACIVALILQARTFFAREETWRKRDQEQRDQLWQLAGGKKLTVHYEREKIVKVPDPDAAPPPMNAWDESIFNDMVKEEIEQIHPATAGMSIAQVRAQYPREWDGMAQQLREERRPIRTS